MSDSKTTLGDVTPDIKKKLANLMQQSARIYQERDDLMGGLKDTIKAVAEELGVKPASLSKATVIYYKNNLADAKESFDTVEDILNAVGAA